MSRVRLKAKSMGEKKVRAKCKKPIEGLKGGESQKTTKGREVSNSYTSSHKKGGFQGHISLGISMAERPNKFKPNGKEIGYV